MADTPFASHHPYYNINSREVPVPGTDIISSLDLFEEPYMFGGEQDFHCKTRGDPLMGAPGERKAILPPTGGHGGGSLYPSTAGLYESSSSHSAHHHIDRLEPSSSSTGGPPFPGSNNFWLTPQSSMAFQAVSVASSQLPPVGAEYQIQTGMESIASPYSPESEGSYDDPNDTFQLRLPPGFEKEPIQKLTEEQLVSLSARDLNTICRDLPEDVVKQLKKRRRTLKNRGYAYNSRVRRVSQKNQLEKERDELQKQIAQLQDKVKSLEHEKEGWKRKAQMYERGGNA